MISQILYQAILLQEKMNKQAERSVSEEEEGDSPSEPLSGTREDSGFVETSQIGNTATEANAHDQASDADGRSKRLLPTVTPTNPKKPKRIGADEKPKRPLSAYNLFFKEERVRWLEEPSQMKKEPEAETAKEKSRFLAMGKEICRRWMQLTDQQREKYNRQAEQEMQEYRRRKEEHKAETVWNTALGRAALEGRAMDAYLEASSKACAKQTMTSPSRTPDKGRNVKPKVTLKAEQHDIHQNMESDLGRMSSGEKLQEDKGFKVTEHEESPKGFVSVPGLTTSAGSSPDSLLQQNLRYGFSPRQLDPPRLIQYGTQTFSENVANLMRTPPSSTTQPSFRSSPPQSTALTQEIYQMEQAHLLSLLNQRSGLAMETPRLMNSPSDISNSQFSREQEYASAARSRSLSVGDQPVSHAASALRDALLAQSALMSREQQDLGSSHPFQPSNTTTPMRSANQQQEQANSTDIWGRERLLRQWLERMNKEKEGHSGS